MPPVYALIPRRSFFALLLLCFCALLAGGCAGKDLRRSDSSASPRFALPNGKSASDAEALNVAAGADYILIGEHHDNPDDHKAQARYIELLAETGLRPRIGLEMLPRKRYDSKLHSFLQGGLSLEELPGALDWKKTWGYDFALYLPIFEVAQAHSLPVYGLNLPDAVRRSVSRKGLAGLQPEEQAELPGRIIPPLPEQRKKLAAIFNMHAARRAGHPPIMPRTKGARPKPLKAVGAVPGQSGAGAGSFKSQSSPPGAALDRFMLVQSLWDSTMAEQAVILRRREQDRRGKESHKAPMVILAGAGHVEYGYGIAARLRAFDPGARILLIMPYSGLRPDPGAAGLYFYSEAPIRTPYGFSFVMRNGALRIHNVNPGSQAAAVLRKGDRITMVNNVPLRAPSDVYLAAEEAKRQGRPLYLSGHRQEAPAARGAAQKENLRVSLSLRP